MSADVASAGSPSVILRQKNPASLGRTATRSHLVHGHQCGPTLNRGQQTALLIVERLVASSTTTTSAASASASRLRAMPSCSASSKLAFAGLAQAGRVHQFQRNAIERDPLGDRVARGAGSCGHNGAVALDEPVEERALADVGPAHNGQRQPVVNDAAAREGCFKRGQRRRQLADASGDLGLRRHVDVVFGKVDARFEQRDQFHQRLLHRLHAAAERAAHLAGGLPRLGQRLRIDQVAHRLGLREVELAGQKRALGKLARLGQPRAQLQCAAQQQLQHHRRAVRRNLNQILGGVRVWRGKKSDHRLVDASGIDF